MTDTRIEHHNFRCDKGHEWTTPDPLGFSMTVVAGNSTGTVQFCPFCWLAALGIAHPMHEVTEPPNSDFITEADMAPIGDAA